MRNVLVLRVGTSFLVASSLNCQIAPSAAGQELRRIELETAGLEEKNDVSLGKYLSNDWVCGGARRLSKTEFIRNAKHNLRTNENGSNPYTMEKRNIEVHVFGETAVVTHVKKYRQVPASSKFFAEQGSEVFLLEVSGWHLRFTKIAPFQMQSHFGF